MGNLIFSLYFFSIFLFTKTFLGKLAVLFVYLFIFLLPDLPNLNSSIYYKEQYYTFDDVSAPPGRGHPRPPWNPSIPWASPKRRTRRRTRSRITRGDDAWGRTRVCVCAKPWPQPGSSTTRGFFLPLTHTPKGNSNQSTVKLPLRFERREGVWGNSATTRLILPPADLEWMGNVDHPQWSGSRDGKPWQILQAHPSKSAPLPWLTRGLQRRWPHSSVTSNRERREGRKTGLMHASSTSPPRASVVCQRSSQHNFTHKYPHAEISSCTLSSRIILFRSHTPVCIFRSRNATSRINPPADYSALFTPRNIFLLYYGFFTPSINLWGEKIPFQENSPSPNGSAALGKFSFVAWIRNIPFSEKYYPTTIINVMFSSWKILSYDHQRGYAFRWKIFSHNRPTAGILVSWQNIILQQSSAGIIVSLQNDFPTFVNGDIRLFAKYYPTIIISGDIRLSEKYFPTIIRGDIRLTINITVQPNTSYIWL